jgi:hypothetical protein
MDQSHTKKAPEPGVFPRDKIAFFPTPWEPDFGMILADSPIGLPLPFCGCRRVWHIETPF